MILALSAALAFCGLVLAVDVGIDIVRALRPVQEQDAREILRSSDDHRQRRIRQLKLTVHQGGKGDTQRRTGR